MKVKIIKQHYLYSGEVDLSDERANYLIRVGVAKNVKAKVKKPKQAKAK